MATLTPDCGKFFDQLAALAVELGGLHGDSGMFVELSGSINAVHKSELRVEIMAAISRTSSKGVRVAAAFAKRCLEQVKQCRKITIDLSYAYSAWPVEEEKLLCREWDSALQCFGELCHTINLTMPRSIARLSFPWLSTTTALVPETSIFAVPNLRIAPDTTCPQPDRKTLSVTLPEGMSLANSTSLTVRIQLEAASAEQSIVQPRAVDYHQRHAQRQPSSLSLSPLTSSVKRLFWQGKKTHSQLPGYDELYPVGDEELTEKADQLAQL